MLHSARERAEDLAFVGRARSRGVLLPNQKTTPFMKTNHVRAKLKRGEPSVGTWLTLPDPVSARLMARVGFDWLTVELEHTPVNLETAAHSLAIIASSGPAPLVRVPVNSVENIKRVLDI